ncbi:MAG: luciferase [Haloferacaceae archaeon]
MLRAESLLEVTSLDAAALKPSECDVSCAFDLPFERVAIDYEGREHLPDLDLLAELAGEREIRLTTPVRADGFDPLGDDSLLSSLPEEVAHVLVAGHPAYLSAAERKRAVAPRLGAARERVGDAWVGTEGIERIALAAGGTQYELLSRRTERELRSLRSAGLAGDVAVYAPTVLTADEDEILDAVGDYVSRRRPVAEALPQGAATDSAATGRARSVLLAAADDFALTGTPEAVGDRVRTLKEAGADVVVGYPARGVSEFVA